MYTCTYTYNVLLYIYIYIYIHTYLSEDMEFEDRLGAPAIPRDGDQQESGKSVTPNPHHKILVFPDPTLGKYRKILAHPSKYLSNIFVWATQPLANILVAEILVCELGVLII